jgi:hypothetical protein
MSSFQLFGSLTYQSTFEDVRKSNPTLVAKVADRHQVGVMAYYKSLISKRFHQHLLLPMYPAHITIVSNKEFAKVRHHPFWEKHEGLKVTFNVHPEQLYKSWQFWMLHVTDTGRFNELRSELGLKPIDTFHITVAREYLPEDYPAFRPEMVVPYNRLSFGG